MVTMEPYIKKALDAAENDDQRMNILTYYVSLYNQKVRELQDKIRLTEVQIDELTTSLEALKDIDHSRDIKFNLGAGVYAPGKSVKGNIMVDIGSNYVLETSHSEVKKINSERLDNQVSILSLLTKDYSNSVAQLKQLNDMARELVHKYSR